MGIFPERVAIVSTVRAPLSVLEPWIRYHQSIGIARFFLYLDDPLDPAAPALADKPAVSVLRCDTAYWRERAATRPPQLVQRQVFNVNHGLASAAADGCEWVAHIDCDELIHPARGLAETLAGCSTDGLLMAVREAVPERLDHDSIFEARLFKRPPGRLRAVAARLLGCRRAFFAGEYFRGHDRSKMFVRSGGGVRRMGVHRPLETTADSRITIGSDLLLLHFDCVGQSDWESKWRLRLQVERQGSGMRPARIRQLEAFAAAAGSGQAALERLYRDSRMLPGYEKAVLRRLGLLETIELDDASLAPQGRLSPGTAKE